MSRRLLPLTDDQRQVLHELADAVVAGPGFFDDETLAEFDENARSTREGADAIAAGMSLAAVAGVPESHRLTRAAYEAASEARKLAKAARKHRDALARCRDLTVELLRRAEAGEL